MFRDESAKVVQKAHAQWGVQDSPDDSEASGSSPTSTSPTSSAGGRTRSSFTESVSSGSPVSPDGRSLAATRVPKEIRSTLVDRAVQFYLEHYVIGLPDEARAGQELRQEPWVFSTITRDTMAAVGLASQSNLTGDKDLMVLARQQYGLALQGTAFGLKDIQGLDIGVYLRAIVMLGMFEIVGGDGLPTKGAQTHIMGGAALMKSLLPFFQASPDGLRGLIQLCFSMVATVMCSVQQLSPEPNILVPTQPVPSMAEGILPPSFVEFAALGSSMASPEDMPGAELLNLISRFVQLSAYVRSRLFKDGQPEAFGIMRNALDIEQRLEDWERRQEGIWTFTEERAEKDFFPPGTVFEDCYHTYANMWTARAWTNYRFARILVNQLLLESVEHFPSTSLPLVPAAQQRRSYDTIKRVARDTFVSIPTHYRHPRLNQVHRGHFERTKGGAGIGAAQIPTLLFQLKVAGAAPGVPHSYWSWALDMMRTIWADTGMLQAKRLSDLLVKVREEPPQTTVFIKWEDE
ncbi:white-opaque regulator 1 [Podospora aff. communis PSN243]|uniref:White-opaque regulator 1 n=1 Tax=Podospora aff. communis PSN243 TaxID=3040156 RepID=A0AAV9H6N3_9PEZI|nr:white-opaque regulator 1 [Podospora aff. communis PSN243]